MTDKAIDEEVGQMDTAVVETGTIQVKAVRRDGGTQSRDGLDEATVTEYMDVMREHGPMKFPAIKVVFDGTNYWLYDGFHRHEAAARLGVMQLPVEVIQGTQRDAVLMSTGVNADHGLRRTNADKRRAVETLLRDPEWAKWSDREIARRTATSNRFVGNMREELGPTVNESQTPDDAGKTRTVQRGGKTFEMQVGKIGADKRDGQGADTWALIERGVWKFMAGIYYAIDQKHKVIYFTEAAGLRPLTAAMCEHKYPGCIAVAGKALNSDWETYRAAGYTFKSPSEFPRQSSLPSYASEKFPMEWYVTDYDVSSKRYVVYVPGFDDLKDAQAYKDQIQKGGLTHHSAMKQHERSKLVQRDSVEVADVASSTPWYVFSKFRVGLAAICHKCAKNYGKSDGHTEWEPTETPKLWRCKRCRGRTSDALMKIEGQVTVPATEQVAGEAEAQSVQAATNGLTSEVIAKHRRLAEVTHFRVINNKCRPAGRALQKINFEHGLEAAQIAAKGMVEILADCAHELVKADKEWQKRLDAANKPKRKGK